MPYQIAVNNTVIKQFLPFYESGKVTTIYGNAASGKTTCCFLAAIECVKNHGKVVFVDTENSFSVERLQQLGCTDDILEKVFLLQPQTFEEQNDIILKIKKLCEKDSVKLVIVDSIGNYYRKLLNDKPKEINKLLVEQMANLVRIARDLDKVVLITNQVYADMQKGFGLKMVGGSIVEKLSKCIIELELENNKRTATCKKYKLEEEASYIHLGKKLNFIIEEKGFSSDSN